MIKHSANNSASPAIQINVSRGPIVESRHLVNAVVSDASGAIVKSWGNIDKPVYLRSAIKLLQALPLLESGAAEAFDVSEKEISLACASHTGEDIHVTAVTSWLNRLGLSVDNLECGSHWPTYRPAERALASSGQSPNPAHNNCSGKHTGFLATALHLGDGLKGYIDLKHPVQKRLVKILEDFTEMDLSDAPVGIDGCSIPTLGIPLDRAALAIAKFADPDKLPKSRAEACKRIQAAIAKEPTMIAGSDRLCTALNGSADGAVIAKVGAEGVYLAALPEQGLGIALKAIDGTTRAAEVALGAILEDLDIMTESMHSKMDAFIHPNMENWNKIEVGTMSASLGG